MFDIFGWLRRKARESVIGGVEDALLVLAPAGQEQDTDLDALRNRLAAASQPKALPAPAATSDDEDDAEPAKRGKAKK